MVLKEKEWSAFLTKFADLVSSGEYKKTNYSTWRDMKSWHGADVWTTGQIYTVEDIDCPFNYHDFDVNDGSFGKYVNDVWQEESSNTNLAKKEKEKSYADVDIKCSEYTLEADGAIKFIDPATGDLINITGVKSPTGLSAESNTCSTATAATSNSINTISYDDCVVKGNTINSVLIGKYDTIDVKVDEFVRKDEFDKTIEDMKNRLNTKMDVINEKENNNMKMFGNFDFGKVDGNTVRMSMYGLAVKNNVGTWVSYNTATNEVIDVDVMNFDGSNFMYKIPVAIEQVKVGDIVIHNRKPIYVTGIADGKLSAIDVMAGEEKVVLLTRNMFGFNFVTKVVSLMDMTGMAKPSAENPFGNMWMLAMMGDNKEFDFKDMLMMQMLSGQLSTNGSMNPMLALLLAKDGITDNDMMMALAMSGAFNTNAPTAN